MGSEFYIDAELIKRVPTPMLLTELRRRVNESVDTLEVALRAVQPVASPVLATLNPMPMLPPTPPAPEEVTGPRVTTLPLRPVMTPLKVKRVEEGTISEAARSQALADLADPETKALMAEMQAQGDTQGLAYLESLPKIVASMGQKAPGIEAIVQANTRHAEAAFIQPILPPDLSKVKNQPTEIGYAWWDYPCTVTINFDDIAPTVPDQLASIRARPGQEAVVAAMVSSLKRAASIMQTDHYLGHLPKPSLRVNPTAKDFRIILTPMVIWRFVTHMSQLVPLAQLNRIAEILNHHLDQCVNDMDPVHLTPGANMADQFKADVTQWLVTKWHGPLGDDPALAAKRWTALKRQIRIMNVDFSEIAIPAEAPPGISDPRQLNPLLRDRFPAPATPSLTMDDIDELDLDLDS